MMRRAWPALPAALLVSGALYALLLAVEPPHRAPKDPWLEAWARAGIDAKFITSSTDPERDFQIREQRSSFAGPEFAGTTLRNYTLSQFKAQVVELPGIHHEGEMTSETTHDGKTAWHATGRHQFVLSLRNRLLWNELRMPAELRERIVRIFRETAERRP